MSLVLAIHENPRKCVVEDLKILDIKHSDNEKSQRNNIQKPIGVKQIVEVSKRVSIGNMMGLRVWPTLQNFCLLLLNLIFKRG